MGMRLVWTWLGGAFCGALILAFLVYPPAPNWGSAVKWGDIGGWLGGVGSIAAALVALWLAGQASRREGARDKATAESIATAICNELVGNCWDLEEGLAVLNELEYPLYGVNEQFEHLHDKLQSLRYSTFKLFKGQVSCFELPIASAINVAYGGFVVCRDVEKSTEVSLRYFENNPSSQNERKYKSDYIDLRRVACEELFDETLTAIRLIWPLTSYASISGPITTVAEKKLFEELRKAHRSSQINS